MALPVAVRALYQSAPLESQNTIKAGVILALDEWQYGANGYHSLASLAAVATLIRATAVIPRLTEVIRRECRFRRRDSSSLDALSAATASLAGFAPAFELDRWLKILYYDSALLPTLGGLIFIGLCKGRPDAISLHTSRLLELALEAPDAYEHLGFALLDAVPPVELVNQFRPLSLDAKAWLAMRLMRVTHPELKFEFVDAGVEIVWAKQPHARVAVANAPTDMSRLYQHQLSKLSADPNIGLLRWIAE